ncbi:hypothetical protein BD408DRAFT_428865 [Parasitella parasitica]|nr:hypothetical protein BD408DRAFT_428865 [Parasitella parasitica]
MCERLPVVHINGDNNRCRGRSSAGRNSRRESNTTRSTGSHKDGPSADPPKCEHHKPMALKTVVKPGPNKGREFYSCSENDQCNSFQWADEANSNNFRNNTSTDNNSSSNSNGAATPFCNCGIPSVERKVRKDNANKGRAFYCCAAEKDKACEYFAWVD